ncbi:sigma-70 family RNA polymerase sigma factor [Nonomuraea sp. NPDC005650]|uniref:RNA polymerase sigma factor n=1 Tax=Nonomuraea sp. NPDC005650 TaxID=3157045 RepID=UPI0033A9D67E
MPIGPADDDDGGPLPPERERLTYEQGYRKYREPLLKYVRRRARERNLPESVADTEGIVHDAFEKARPHWDTITPLGYLAYLRTIADRLLSRRIKDDERRGEADDDDLERPSRHVGRARARSAEDVEDRIEVTERLRPLPPRQRKAVWRRDVEGDTSEEIGKDLGCSPEAVDSMVYRGRERARRVARWASSVTAAFVLGLLHEAGAWPVVVYAAAIVFVIVWARSEVRRGLDVVRRAHHRRRMRSLLLRYDAPVMYERPGVFLAADIDPEASLHVTEPAISHAWCAGIQQFRLARIVPHADPVGRRRGAGVPSPADRAGRRRPPCGHTNTFRRRRQQRFSQRHAEYIRRRSRNVVGIAVRRRSADARGRRLHVSDDLLLLRTLTIAMTLVNALINWLMRGNR